MPTEASQRNITQTTMQRLFGRKSDGKHIIRHRQMMTQTHYESHDRTTKEQLRPHSFAMAFEQRPEGILVAWQSGVKIRSRTSVFTDNGQFRAFVFGRDIASGNRDDGSDGPISTEPQPGSGGEGGWIGMTYLIPQHGVLRKSVGFAGQAPGGDPMAGAAPKNTGFQFGLSASGLAPRGQGGGGDPFSGSDIDGDEGGSSNGTFGIGPGDGGSDNSGGAALRKKNGFGGGDPYGGSEDGDGDGDGDGGNDSGGTGDGGVSDAGTTLPGGLDSDGASTVPDEQPSNDSNFVADTAIFAGYCAVVGGLFLLGDALGPEATTASVVVGGVTAVLGGGATIVGGLASRTGGSGGRFTGVDGDDTTQTRGGVAIGPRAFSVFGEQSQDGASGWILATPAPGASGADVLGTANSFSKSMVAAHFSTHSSDGTDGWITITGMPALNEHE